MNIREVSNITGTRELQEPSEYKMARQFLGENFLSPQEVSVPVKLDEDRSSSSFR